MWVLYALVNVEERYVTLAYLVVILPIFAALRTPTPEADDVRQHSHRDGSHPPRPQ